MIETEVDVVTGREHDRAPQRWQSTALGRLGAAIIVASVVFGIAAGSIFFAGLFAVLGWTMITIAPRGLRGQQLVLHTKRERIVIDETTLTAGDVRIPLSAITLAYVQPHEGEPPTVRCEDWRGLLVFEARPRDAEEAAALVTAIEAPHHRRSWLGTGLLSPTPHRFYAWLLAIPVVAGLAFWLASMLGPVAALVAFFAMFILGFWPLVATSSVTVGSDGIAQRWLGFERFMPWSRVTGIASTEHGVMIEGGRQRFLVDVIPRRYEHGQSKALQRAAFLEQLNAAWKAWQATVPAPSLADRLARGDRPVAAWQAELRALDDEGGAYRAAPVRTEDLWRIVGDAAEPEENRAAAAVALRGRDAPERLRAVAEEIVSPRLRVVLERAADPASEDEAIAEALEEIPPRARA